MSSYLSRLLRGDAESRARGATLFVIGAVMFLLLALGGVAVDLSSKANRGQELQNAVDAAALAAVNEYNTSLDQVKARKLVTDILTQNGEGLTAQVVFTSATQVSVTVTDPNFTGLFAGATGDNSGVSRTATASQDVCVLGCNQIVEVPPLIYPIEAAGTGDGFLPIEVGDRFYSINHHEDTVDCVDVVLNSNCVPWTADQSSLPAGLSSNYITSGTHHPELIGTKIYYTLHPSPVGWYSNFDPEAGDTILTCFDTVTNQPCTTMANLGVVGHGVMAVVANNIYVFTSNTDVYCFTPPSLSECTGYVGGQAGPLSAVGSWALDRSSAWGSDRRIFGTKIYSTMHLDHASDGTKDKTFIQCWDVAANGNAGGVCSGWGNNGRKAVPNSQNFGYNNRVFLSRDTTGNPNGVCVLARSAITCWDLSTGNKRADIASPLAALLARMNTATSGEFSGVFNTNGWSGMNSYHPPSNRLFTVNAKGSTTFCYDFTTATVCPDDATAGGPKSGIAIEVGGKKTQTYGYIPDGDTNCMIGLGDQSIFHTMKADLSGPCDSSGGEALITPCGCTGAANTVWPDLEAVNADGVTDFRVRIADLAGNPVAPDNTDPNAWHDLLNGPLTLNKLVHTDPTLKVIFDVTVDVTLDPTLLTPPTFVIRGQTIAPHLVD